MKIKMNLGGQVVEAEKMEFTPINEMWSTYKLTDGTVVKMKLVVQDVFKLPNNDPLTGIPQYIVRSTNVLSVEPPIPTEEIH